MLPTLLQLFQTNKPKQQQFDKNKLRDYELKSRKDDFLPDNFYFKQFDQTKIKYNGKRKYQKLLKGSKIILGVIGVGQRGITLLLKLLLNYSDHFESILIYDESKTALDKAYKIFKEQNYHQVQCVENYNQILENQSVTWVFIASMNSRHAEQCIQAFQANKNVFCEKPLACTIEDCQAIRSASLKANKTFITGFVLRYSPFYQKIKEITQSGLIGRVISAEGNELLNPDHGAYIMRNWRRHKDLSGPHILEKCAHDIDILNWIIQSKPQKVSAFGGNDIFLKENNEIKIQLQEEQGEFADSNKLFENWPVWEDVDAFTSEKTVEDNLVGIIQYENGVRATFHTNCCSAIMQRRILICGLEGTLEADLKKMKIYVKRLPRNAKPENIEFPYIDSHAGGDIQIVNEWFQHMINKDLQPLSSLNECFISSICALSLDLARQQEKVITIDWEKIFDNQ